jgi:hypothetical protein
MSTIAHTVQAINQEHKQSGAQAMHSPEITKTARSLTSYERSIYRGPAQPHPVAPGNQPGNISCVVSQYTIARGGTAMRQTVVRR